MRRAGFTLLELLVSITVLALLLAIVYAGVDSISRNAELANSVTREMRQRQFLTQHFGDTLPSVYADPSLLRQAYAFSGRDTQGPHGPANSLRFVSSAPLRSGKALPGMLKTVTYQVTEAGAPDEDAAGFGGEERLQLALQYSEQALVIDEDGSRSDAGVLFRVEDGAEHGWEIPIQSIDFSYHDGEAWQPEWSSIDQGFLPWAVRVRINFPKTEDELRGLIRMGVDPQEDADLDIIYPIPLGTGVQEPFIPLNPNAQTEAENSLFRDMPGRR